MVNKPFSLSLSTFSSTFFAIWLPLVHNAHHRWIINCQWLIDYLWTNCGFVEDRWVMLNIVLQWTMSSQNSPFAMPNWPCTPGNPFACRSWWSTETLVVRDGQVIKLIVGQTITRPKPLEIVIDLVLLKLFNVGEVHFFQLEIWKFSSFDF